MKYVRCMISRRIKVIVFNFEGMKVRNMMFIEKNYE